MLPLRRPPGARLLPLPHLGPDGGPDPAHLEEVWDRNKEAQSSLEERCRRYGLPYEVFGRHPRSGESASPRDSLDGDGESFSPDRHRLSKKLLGDLRDFRLGRCSMHLQPNSWFHSSGTTSSRSPSSPSMSTRHWYAPRLVADDAVEGVDYDLEKLTWKQTNLQDKAFVELCQKGAGSPMSPPVHEERIPGRGVHQLVRAARAGALGMIELGTVTAIQNHSAFAALRCRGTG